MSFLFRIATTFNVGAAMAVKTLKYHRPVFNCAHFATSPFVVTKTVKLDTYIDRRKSALNKLKSATETMRQEIATNLDAMSAFNARDVQELIYTAEEADVDLVIAALKRMELQPERVRFSLFQMDAVTMRMFSFLDLPNKALEAFLDEELKAVFVNYSTIVILLDLLYRHEMYEEVMQCIDTLEKRQNFLNWTSTGVGCFYMSSCLKVNTPEVLKKGFLYFEKIVKYREPMPQLASLALVIASRTCPEKLDFVIDLLNNKLRSAHPKTVAPYSDIKTNVVLQTLIASQKLSDIESYLGEYQGRIAKDIYDSIVTLAKELGVENPDKISKGCKILDVTLEEWVNLENSKAEREMDKVAHRKPGTFKARQEFYQ